MQNLLVLKSRFASTKREKLLNYNAYFDEASDLIERIPRAETRLKDETWVADKDAATLMRMTEARAEYALTLIALQYSAGATISELRALFVATVDFFEAYARYADRYNKEQGPAYKSPHITLGDSGFQDANRLVCFAILLGLENLLPRIAAIIDYDCPASDGMLDRLLSVYLEGRANPNECTRHLPYFKTLKIFAAPKEDRSALMTEYLADWYEASRRESYFESHKRDYSFTGYWSWEAAAISVALDIDDSPYRDAQFYPRDLVDFAREAMEEYSPDGAPADDYNEVRVKAGEPCPKAGSWESLDVKPVERQFEFWQPMTDLKSAYGLTVWRFVR